MWYRAWLMYRITVLTCVNWSLRTRCAWHQWKNQADLRWIEYYMRIEIWANHYRHISRPPTNLTTTICGMVKPVMVRIPLDYLWRYRGSFDFHGSKRS